MRLKVPRLWQRGEPQRNALEKSCESLVLQDVMEMIGQNVVINEINQLKTVLCMNMTYHLQGLQVPMCSRKYVRCDEDRY